MKDIIYKDDENVIEIITAFCIPSVSREFVTKLYLLDAKTYDKKGVYGITSPKFGEIFSSEPSSQIKAEERHKKLVEVFKNIFERLKNKDIKHLK